MAATKSIRSGFTLIEVLVASSILVVTTGALVSLGRASLRSQSLAYERSQAYQLVQEGFEVVRQIRDTTSIDATLTNGIPNSWDSSFPVLASQGSTVGPIWDGFDRRWRLVENSTGTDAAITAGVETIVLDGLNFRRTLTFLPMPDQYDQLVPLTGVSGALTTGFHDSARLIQVAVTWESQGEVWTVSGRTVLSNWKKIG